jgi:hypothetical protein
VAVLGDRFAFIEAERAELQDGDVAGGRPGQTAQERSRCGRRLVWVTLVGDVGVK